MKRPYRVLIVDDEKPARARLEALLKRQPAVEVASCAGGEAALEEVTAAAEAGAAIDIIFLDVQMPEMDGFEMLDALYGMPVDPMPVIVFATAHDAYALRAFDAHAVDYLLKPYSDERFEAALSRAMRLAESTDSDSLLDQMHALLTGLSKSSSETGPAADAFLDRVAIKERGRVRLIAVGDIRWIAASGVYVIIHTGTGEYLHREVLGRLEDRLDPRRFVRVHRSHIVNFDFVRELVQDSHGDYAVKLADGTALKVSRLYRPRLEERLQQRL